MSFVSLTVAGLALARPGPAQLKLIGGPPFPAEQEFRELGAIRNETAVSEPARLQGVAEASLFREAGLQSYHRRVYAVSPEGELAVDIVGFRDGKAPYSLLSLLRSGAVAHGPPGDFLAAGETGLVFAQANYLVRIESDRPSDLPRRVATSVGNRIGTHERAPTLVSRFPAPGKDATSLRYFLGPASLDRYAYSAGLRHARIPDEVEAAQARYALDGRDGTLALLNFPTSQLAEEYYDRLFAPGHADSPWKRTGPGSALFFKRAGPLVAVLEGSFDAASAERVLQPLEFTYSVKWIFDKRNHSGRTVWGIPMGILGTVVRSIFFTGLLCGLSIIVGVSVALFRVAMRTYAPNNFLDRPERTEMIRLKINEN